MQVAIKELFELPFLSLAIAKCGKCKLNGGPHELLFTPQNFGQLMTGIHEAMRMLPPEYGDALLAATEKQIRGLKLPQHQMDQSVQHVIHNLRTKYL